MSDTEVSKKREVQGACSRIQGDSACDGEPSTKRSKSYATIAKSEDTDATQSATVPLTHGVKSFLHGITYQLEITTMILCEGAEQHKKESGFKFTISCEDSEGGKFDDIGFRYGNRRLYVQAKHAMVPSNITWSELRSSDQQAPFAIGKYFGSFLDKHSNTPTTLIDLVLLTNNGLSDDVVQCMKEYSFEDACVTSIFKSLGSTLYKFDFEKLNDNYPDMLECLNEFSDIVCLAKLLAECIFEEKLVDLRKPLVKKYRYVIRRDIAKTTGVAGNRKRKTEKKKGVLEFNEEFLNRSITYSFKTEFEIQYKKISKMDNVWEDVSKKGIRLSNKFLADCNVDEALELPKYVEIQQKQKFFEALVIACNTKDEESLAGDIIGKLRNFNIDLLYEMDGWSEADVSYGKLSKRMLDWMKGKQNEALNQNFVAAFLNHMVYSIFYLYLKGISKFNCIKFQKTDLQLDPVALTKTQFYLKMESWLSKDHCAFHVEEYGYNNIPLIAWQVLVKLCEKLHESKLQYLIINRDSFVQKQNEIMNVSCGLDYALILAIDCGSSDIEEMRNTLQSHYLNFSKSAKTFHHKKIILLRKYDSTLEQDPLKIGDLTTASKNKFYDGNKKRFGTEISSKLLFRDDDALRLALDATHYNKIMDQDIIEEKFNNIKNKYINRTWMGSDGKNRNNSITFWYSKIRGIEIEFSKDSSKIEKDLLDVRDRSNRRIPPPGVNIKESAKVCIFLDEAGSGKSFYFTWLANELKVMFPTWWVIKFNMIEYASDFSWLMDNNYHRNMTTEQAVRILFQFIYLVYYAKFKHPSSEEVTEKEREKSRQCANALYFEANCIRLDEDMSLSTEEIILVRLFQNKFNENKLVLVFDGFDEIAPDYNDIALTFLQKIGQTGRVKKMYLSSRPYDFSRDFEATLKSCVFYQFNQLDRLDTLIFIDKFLSRSEQYCKIYSNKNEYEKYFLTQVLFKILYKNLENLSKNPLFLEIGLDLLLNTSIKNQDDFEISRLDSPEMWKEYEKILEVLNLMNYFVKQKWEIAIKGKLGITEASAQIPTLKKIIQTEKKKFDKIHTLLAYHVIFNKKQRSFLSDVERDDTIKYMTEVKEGSVNYGIIEGVVGEVPLFVHRLFAEYYAATGMYEKSLTDKGNGIKHFLKNNVYHKSEHNEVRFFLDRLLCKDHPLHMAIINKSPTVELILENNPSTVNETDVWGRSPLHLAVLYNPIGHINLLLEKLNPTDINVCDKYFEWTALDNVFTGNKMHLVCTLIQNGASINTTAMFQKVHSNDHLKMFFNAIYLESFLFNRYMYKRGKLLPEDAIEHLLKRVGDELNLVLNLQIIPSNDLIESAQMILNQFEEEELWINERFKYVTLHDGKCTTWMLIEWCVVFDSKLFQILIEKAGGCDKVFSKEQTEKLIKLACQYRAPYALQYMLASYNGSILHEFGEFTEILIKIMLDKTINKEEEEGLVNRYNQLSSIPECLLTWDDWNCIRLAVKRNNLMFVKFVIFKLSLVGNNEVILKLLSKSIYYCNAACHFLCDTNPNLHIIDEKGRDLLQKAILNDCLPLVRCLGDHYNFNVNKENELENNWHAFFYCVTTECPYNESMYKSMFEHMFENNPIDCFRVKDALGNSIINYALKNNFLITEYIVSKLGLDEIQEKDTKNLLNDFEISNIDVYDMFCFIVDKVTATVLKSFCNHLHDSNKLRNKLEKGRNLLQVAVMKGWFNLVQCLIQHFNFKPTEINEQENNWNAFFYCVKDFKNFESDIFKYMWENETVEYLNQKDAQGKNIFYYAVKSNSYAAGFVVSREIKDEMEHFTENEMLSLWRLFEISDLDLADFFGYLKDVQMKKDCEDAFTLDEQVLKCACNVLANANRLYTKMHKGRNLLHIAVTECWVDMVEYLIVHCQFKPTEINEQENCWNAYFYCVAKPPDKNTTCKLFTFMMDEDPVDCFGLQDSNGKSIFFYALHNLPVIADYIITKEFKAKNVSSMNERCLVFLNRIKELNLSRPDIEKCLQQWELVSLLPDKDELHEYITGKELKSLQIKQKVFNMF